MFKLIVNDMTKISKLRYILKGLIIKHQQAYVWKV